MPNLFHKYQQPIWMILTIGVIASFILFWNGNMMSHGVLGGPEKVATIYGQTISNADFLRGVRKFQIAAALGLAPLVQPLAGSAQNQSEAIQQFVFNSYVFEHEADALQVFPTDAEVQDEYARVPGFQTDGRFDPAKLTDFVQNKLPAMGFTDSVIDELVREEVRVRKVTELIGSTVDISAAELQNRYMAGNELMALSVIRLNTSDLAKSITVSDADANQAYTAHPENYQSAEERKVSIASFELTEEQKQLKGKDRTDALQKLGNDAWTFAQAVVDKSANFADEAKKAAAPVRVSGFFTAGQPDPTLPDVAAIPTTAFKLSADYPSSDVVEGANGYYVLHLEGVTPSRQLTFEEAKAQVVATIQHDRAAQLLQTKANDIRNQVLAGLKAGKAIADAAAAAGVRADAIAPFSLSNASKVDVPDLESILENAVALGDGQLSDIITTQAGGLLVYMQGREPIDKAAAAAGEIESRDRYAVQKQEQAFLEWLRLRKEAARLQLATQGA